MNKEPKSFPSNVSDEEWAFSLRDLKPMTEPAPQRVCPFCEIFNVLRYMVNRQKVRRMMPHDLPFWQAIYPPTRRWIKNGFFAAMVHALRAILRLVMDRKADPSAVNMDSRTLQSTLERMFPNRSTGKNSSGPPSFCLRYRPGLRAGYALSCRSSDRI